MADAKTEKQKVKEITDKLEEGLKELFESEKYSNLSRRLSGMAEEFQPSCKQGGRRESVSLPPPLIKSKRNGIS